MRRRKVPRPNSGAARGRREGEESRHETEGTDRMRQCVVRDQKSPRWSAERRGIPSRGVPGASSGARVPVMARTTGCFTQHPELLGAPPSPSSGMETMQRDPRTRREDEKGKRNGNETKKIEKRKEKE